jgi:hypothetical protein
MQTTASVREDTVVTPPVTRRRAVRVGGIGLLLCYLGGLAALWLLRQLLPGPAGTVLAEVAFAYLVLALALRGAGAVATLRALRQSIREAGTAHRGDSVPDASTGQADDEPQR